MSASNNTKNLLMIFGAALALSACGNGADEVVSPGIPANPPTAPTPAPTPTPSPTPGTGTAAESCPDGTVNQGTIASNTLRACLLPATMTGTVTLKKLDGVAYQLKGQTNVGEDQGGDANAPLAGKARGTLYVEPGVTVFGRDGGDFLLVNRGSQIFALGTADQPITFTSLQGLEGNGAKGNWGGIVISGRAPINSCQGSAVAGAADCQAVIEGTSGSYFGGNSTADNSGELKYVRGLYSGYAIGNGNELQTLTLAGVGSGTRIDYFQSYASKDDGIEIFGGSVNLKHIVILDHDDDGLDTDHGWNGGAQFGLIIRSAGKTVDAGGSGLEWSSINRLPVSQPKIANFTILNKDDKLESLVKVNESTNARILNSVVVTAPASNSNGQAETCFALSNGTLPAPDVTKLELHSVYFSCAKPFNNATAETIYNAATKSNTTLNTSSTLSGFVNGASENAVAAYDAKSVHSFFDNVSYIGAVKDANDNWWKGWTVGLE